MPELPPHTPDDPLEAQLRKLSLAPLSDKGFSSAVLARLPRQETLPKVSFAPYLATALLTAAAGGALSVHFHPQLSAALTAFQSTEGATADGSTSALFWLAATAVGWALSASAYYLPRAIQALR